MIELPRGMHRRVIEAFDIWGIQELYPPQKDAMGPIAKGENLVVAVPTAAGKSLIAYVAILNRFFRKGKALYVVPLRALASEKYEELSELSGLGLRVALSYGDYDDEDKRLEHYDVVVATSEKADSLLRHRSGWLRNLKVIVADEVHLLNDPGRGPTLEVILTRFKQLNPDAQLICLSATIGNSTEIAGWLGARSVTSDFRPVDLKEGVVQGNEVTLEDLGRIEFRARTGNTLNDAVLDGILDSDDGQGQVLVFVNTRKSAETTALEMSDILSGHLGNGDLSELRSISNSIGGSEARVITKLRKAVAGGAAFHHAGLSNEHRKKVEAGFKARRIKALYATPTLAAGINLPARRVIVRDWTRFETWNPRAPIPVLEIKQMFGRAGRPRYDKVGESWVLARKPEEVDLLMERYIWGKPEEVLSKLGARPALRMHMLSSFATNYVKDMTELWDFIKATFYAYQNDTWKISTDVEELMEFLVDEGFLRRGPEMVEATDFGKRVARLYIDPLSAVVIREALRASPKKVTPFSILQVICDTPDVPPLFVRGKESDHVTNYMYAHQDELLIPIPEEEEEYEWYLSSVKTAMFLLEWIGENDGSVEAGEDRIESLFNLGPGDVRNKVETAVWILYAMRELSRLFGSGMTSEIDKVALRVEHGIREELLPLVQLRGIGRVRARRLFEAGYRSVDIIRKAKVSQLAQVKGIGRQLAVQIKNSMEAGEGPMEEEGPEELVEDVGPQQTQLLDFVE
ncbi:MAG: DEAD/DEAH box helicase [Candidatus Thermoplasmatota archaeon]|nr:DEAD/DEAH box helicase [Candidatus Thermoplasmatota archaeon]